MGGRPLLTHWGAGVPRMAMGLVRLGGSWSSINCAESQPLPVSSPFGGETASFAHFAQFTPLVQPWCILHCFVQFCAFWYSFVHFCTLWCIFVLFCHFTQVLAIFGTCVSAQNPRMSFGDFQGFSRHFQGHGIPLGVPWPCGPLHP